ncbi:hypothetical protein BV378_20440 [Nostoc sp. RF31YmG]|nr:hypothetical protein BV378_20440 [Nostoc sp. RF31YmG]
MNLTRVMIKHHRKVRSQLRDNKSLSLAINSYYYLKGGWQKQISGVMLEDNTNKFFRGVAWLLL